MRHPAFFVLAVVLLAGCAAPSTEREHATVDPPEHAGGFARCPTPSAQEIALPLRATVVRDVGNLEQGLYQENATSLLWVWANHQDSQREDRVQRLNAVTLHRESDGTFSLCTRVELSAPVFVSGERTSYAVAARFEAPNGWPRGEYDVVVNWVAACPCTPLPSGNTTARFALGPASL